MSDWLLDTNIISALMRQENSVVARAVRVPPPETILISVITHSEVNYGLRRMPAGRRRRALEREYEQLLPRLGDPIAVTREVAERHARTKYELERQGIILPENDLWIAATALSAGLTLVTDDSHFAAVPDLQTANWLSDS